MCFRQKRLKSIEPKPTKCVRLKHALLAVQTKLSREMKIQSNRHKNMGEGILPRRFRNVAVASICRFTQVNLVNGD